MSIYATVADKTYRVKVPLSNNTEKVAVIELYDHHPVGFQKIGLGHEPEVVEIVGIGRSGEPASVVVPLWVLRHFLKVAEDAGNWSLCVELVGREECLKEFKENARRWRGGV